MADLSLVSNSPNILIHTTIMLKKFKFFLAMICSLIVTSLHAEEATLTFADLGLASGSVVGQTFTIDDNVVLTFDKGGAASDPKISTSGQITLMMNSSLTVSGKSEAIKITRIVLTSPKKSSMFSTNAASCVPEGTFTIDKEALTNTWSDETGANSVQITSTMGAPVFTAITVEYQAEGVAATPYTLSKDFAALGIDGSDLVALSPISLNGDLQLVFEQGTAFSAPKYTESNGRVTLTQNANMRVEGKTDKINITAITLTSPKKSYMFSTNAASCVPEGTFTIDKEALTNTWSNETGANSVQITSTMGSPAFTAIAYTGGTDTGDTPVTPPDDPVVTPESDNAFETDFDTADDFSAMTVINVNPSTYTWRHEKADQTVSIKNEIATTASLPKDDYLVTPALDLKAGMTYRLSFACKAGSERYPEKVEALIGTEPTVAALNTSVIAATTVDWTAMQTLTGYFTVEKDGKYYAAIHATSEPGMFTLYVDDFAVSRGVLPEGPAEILDFAATPDPAGCLEVKLSLTAPSTTMANSTLAEITKITFKRQGKEITSVNATPGEPVTYVDIVEADGMYNYTATIETPAGKGFDASAQAWVGTYAPSVPTNLTVEELEYGKLKFNWDGVTTNIHGHQISPELVSYTIKAAGGVIIAEDLKGTEATVMYPKEGEPQDITTFSIKAVSATLESKWSEPTGTMAVGTPYTMPFEEKFSDGQLDPGHVAEVNADETHPSAKWEYFELMLLDKINPVTDDGGMMGFASYSEGDKSKFTTGKIHIDADATNPYLSFYYYAIPGATDKISVSVGDDVLSEFAIDGENREWVEKLIPLTSYKGKDIRLSFVAHATMEDCRVCVDDIKVCNEQTYDMYISRARIPLELTQGAKHTCSIKVTNRGIEPSGAYDLTVSADGKELWRVDAQPSLSRGETAEHTFVLAYEMFENEKITYNVSLAVGKDENPDNNSVTVEARTKTSPLPAPDGLTYGADGDKIALSWNPADPSASPCRTITEGFESYDEFVRDAAGEWAFIDGDGCNVLGIRDGYHSYPGMFEPMAFMVFNNHDGYFPTIGTSNFDPHEGAQCMVSASIDIINSMDRDNDDWMISPRLSGNAQTISFYARSSGMVFPETIKVMASKSDKVISSFAEVSKYEKIDSKWTKYEVDLEAGTQYFAIRNTSYDQYLLFVDDVTFEAGAIDTTIEGYDVYAGNANDDVWRKLNDNLLAEPKFETEEIESGENVRVDVHYANGCIVRSTPVLVEYSGINDIIGNENTPAIYYDLNGRNLGTIRPEIPGIYVVRQGSATRKVVVK